MRCGPQPQLSSEAGGAHMQLPASPCVAVSEGWGSRADGASFPHPFHSRRLTGAEEDLKQVADCRLEMVVQKGGGAQNTGISPPV